MRTIVGDGVQYSGNTTDNDSVRTNFRKASKLSVGQIGKVAEVNTLALHPEDCRALGFRGLRLWDS
jgi:hypothetical protein